MIPSHGMSERAKQEPGIEKAEEKTVFDVKLEKFDTTANRTKPIRIRPKQIKLNQIEPNRKTVILFVYRLF